MSVKFVNQYFIFGKILESKTNNTYPSSSYAKVTLSSSWKKSDGTKVYSNWIAIFKKDAFAKVSTLNKGDFIKCKGTFTKESYVKAGETQKTFPTDTTMTIFEFEKWVDNREPEKSQEILPEEDEYPF